MKTYVPASIVAISIMAILTAFVHKDTALPEKILTQTSDLASDPLGTISADKKNKLQDVFPDLDQTPQDWREFLPPDLTIAPYPDMKISLHLTEVKIISGRTVAIYKNAQLQAFMVGAATQTGYLANLVIPEAGSFEILANDQATTIIPMKTGPCANLDVAAPPLPAELLNTPVSTTQTYLVDVVFFFSEDALVLTNNSEDLLNSRYIVQIETANMMLANSQVNNFRWRYVGGYQLPHYDTTTNIINDLNVFTNPPTAQICQNAINETGADLAVLVCGADRSPGIGVNSAKYNVIVCNSDPRVLAHEMGHAFGCQHDRDTLGVPDNNGLYCYGYYYNDSNINFGTIMSYNGSPIPYFSNPNVLYQNIPTGVPDTDPRAADNARTLTENAPRVTNLNKTTNPPTIVQQPTDLAIDSPTQVSILVFGDNLIYKWFHNGVLQIITNDPNPTTIMLPSNAFFGTWYVIVSNSIGSVQTGNFTISQKITPVAPQISAQPQAVTVNAGDQLTLQIIATGTNNTYYWLKDNVSIQGATSPIYQKTATVQDSGTYIAGIFNDFGSIMSDPIIVTVLPQNSGVEPSGAGGQVGASGGGGGSGGGGALSIWSILAMALWLTGNVLKNKIWMR